MADPNFIAPITNPFGLTDVGDDAAPTFGDIDNDGDLDAFVGNFGGNTLFYRNTGTATAPAFTLQANNFGLTDVGDVAIPTLADIDNDGDLDAFVGNQYGDTFFYRNTGTTTAPNFTQEATNPFGLNNSGDIAAPTFADIDNDGDLDAFLALNGFDSTLLFYRNTGTTTAPNFDSPVDNPFGVTDVGIAPITTFVDIDNDGDLDAFFGSGDGDTFFYRNTGTTTAPNFTQEATNPFGLTNVGQVPAPTFVDIDGDGDLDAFVGNLDGNILFFENTSATTTTPTVSITAQTATATEGGSNGVYRITRTDTTGDLTINLTLDGGSTAATADYNLSGGSVTVSGNTLSVTIADGQSFVDINLAAFDDIGAEADETLTLNLDTGTGYTVDSTNNTATVTIAANDTVVTNTNDDGEGSLRQAILNANANPGADTITFAGSIFTDATPDVITLTSGALSITDALTINGLGASNLSISGNNTSAVFNIDDGNSSNEIAVAINQLTITAGKDDSQVGGILNRENLTLSNSNISGNTGFIGGIFNFGTLSLTESIVSNNTGYVAGIATLGTLSLTESIVSNNTGGLYGGIFNRDTLVNLTESTVSGNTSSVENGAAGIGILSGTLNLTNSTVSGNTSAFGSGGIGFAGATATVNLINSTVSGNTAGTFAGGIHNYVGTLNLTNSTVSGNTAGTSYGGIASSGTLNLTNSTVSGNTAGENAGGIGSIGATVSLINSTITNNTADSDNNGSGDGGGIFLFDSTGTVTAQNTIIAGNFDSGNEAPDIFGAVTGNGNNLIGSLVGASGSIGTGSDITFASAGITDINQVLAPLANNGGATFTHAIVSGSPAINAGDNTLIPSGVTTDQRGTTRTIGDTVDIGAYESPFIPPVAANETATTDENTVVNINVLGNDTDANGDSLSVAKVNGNSITVGTPITLASGATVSLKTDGTLDYNPNGQFESLAAGATASDSFTYTASDNGNGGTSTATVNLTINGVNDAPTGSPTATLSNTGEDTPITITAADLLAGFTDVDGDTLFVANLTATNGALLDNNNGTYTFTPTADFNGTVTLNYGVTDGTATLAGQSNSFSVTPINVIIGNGRDPLTGTAAHDRIIGGPGAKTITGGAGTDEFVYTSLRDVGHRITDFTVGEDKIVLTQLLSSIGYQGTNPIDDKYVQFIQGSTANTTIVQIDRDGLTGSGIFRNFLQLDNVTPTQINSVNNFVF